MEAADAVGPRDPPHILLWHFALSWFKTPKVLVESTVRSRVCPPAGPDGVKNVAATCKLTGSFASSFYKSPAAAERFWGAWSNAALGTLEGVTVMNMSHGCWCR